MDSVISNLSRVLPQLQGTGEVPTPEEAIVKAADRLMHLNDVALRRSATQELKLYLRQYRDLVADNALRGLVQDLDRDREQPEVVRFILETLLVLFIRGEGLTDLTRNWTASDDLEADRVRARRQGAAKYPLPLLMEHSMLDHLLFWIADELTADVSRFAVLVQLLQESLYPTTVYVLQLVQALAAARLARTQECVLLDPEAIGALVHQLTNPDLEQLRNECLLLLVRLLLNHDALCQAIVFHAEFEVFFQIIAEEGGVRGLVVVLDVLAVLSHLLAYNAVNQQLFLGNSAAVALLTHLLVEPLVPPATEFDPPFFWTQQRLQHATNALTLVRMFVLDQNTPTTTGNQHRLAALGVLQAVLQLTFHADTPTALRVAALRTLADMVHGNAALQAQLQLFAVPFVSLTLTSDGGVKNGEPVGVVDALLTWMLHANSVHVFEVRQQCLQVVASFLEGNTVWGEAYARWCVEGAETAADQHTANGDVSGEVPGEDPEEETSSTTPTFDASTPNLLSILTDYSSAAHLNPYRFWFASVALMRLFAAVPRTQSIIQGLHEAHSGASDDESSSPLQTISGFLLLYLQQLDPRIALGYLQLLFHWLYENPSGVAEFLEEELVVHGMIAYVVGGGASAAGEASTELVALVTVFLGVVYEFSTAECTVPRAKLHMLLVKRLGVDNYSFKARRLLRLLVEYQRHEQELSLGEEPATLPDTGLPPVYFDLCFVDEFREHFPRVVRALAHLPDTVSVGKLLYEVVEELQEANYQLSTKLRETTQLLVEAETKLQKLVEQLTSELSTTSSALATAQKDLAALQEEHTQVQTKFSETEALLELATARGTELDAVVAAHEAELVQLKLRANIGDKDLEKLKALLAATESERAKHADGINKMNKELRLLMKEKEAVEKELSKAKESAAAAAKSHEQAKSQWDKARQALERERDEWKKKHAAQKTQTEETERRVVAAQLAAAEEERNHTEAQRLNAQLTEKLKEAQRQLEAAEAAKVTASERLLLVTSAKELETSKLRKAVGELTSAKDGLEAKVQELEKQVAVSAGAGEKAAEEHARERDGLVARVRELEKDVEQAQQAVQEAELQAATRTKAVEQLQQEVETSNTELEKSRALCGKLQEEIAGLQKTVVELKESVAAHEAEAATVSAALAEAESLLSKTQAELEERLAELVKEREGLRASLELVAKEHAVRVSKMEEELADARSALAAAEAEASEMKEKTVVHEAAAEQMKAETEKKAGKELAEKKAAEAATKKAAAEKAAAEKKVAAAVAAKDAAETAVKAAVAAKEEAEKKAAEATAEKETAEAATKKATAEQEVAEKKAAAAVADKETAEAAVKAATAERDSAVLASKAAVASKDSAEKAVETATASRDSAEKAAAAAAAEAATSLAAAKEEIARLKAQLVEAQSSGDSAKAAAEKAAKQAEEAAESKSALGAEVERLKEELAQLQTENDDLMLVMTDMEDRLKSKIRDLGGEVSDEEDDEE